MFGAADEAAGARQQFGEGAIEQLVRREVVRPDVPLHRPAKAALEVIHTPHAVGLIEDVRRAPQIVAGAAV